MDVPVYRRLENLPTEICALIFDLLDLNSQASLCCVSKSLNATAEYMLYEHLLLPMLTFDDIDRVHKLLVARAASKIHDHTNGVTIIDSYAPPEAISGRLNASGIPLARRIADNTERDHSLYLLISLIPSGNLQIFRHLSSRSLSPRILEYLSHVQRGILFFQATIGSDSQYQPRYTTGFQTPFMFRNLPSLSTCDVTFLNVEGFRDFIQCLTSGPFAFRSSLRNLRIQIPTPKTTSQLLQQYLRTNESRILHLKQLTLDGFDLQGLFSSVSRLTQVQSLTHLTLWNCLHADLFFSEMTSQFLKSPRLIDLKHLTTLFNTPGQRSVDQCLEDLFKICELTSINVVWDEMHGLPTTICTAMSSLAKSLRTLSLHHRTPVHISENDLPYLKDGLNTIIKPCYNLNELGIQVNEYYMLPQIWSIPVLESHKTFWSSLKHLPYLRILHLRQYENCQHPHPRSEREVAWDLERFASGLFCFLDQKGYCVSLRCLVIGMRQSPVFNRVSECLPRHYFLKAKQKVGSSNETIVAVPVSLVQLRGEVPTTTLLDNDPGCDWQGGKPGQFHIKQI